VPRGHRVLLAVDLNDSYDVSARAVNQAVKRNRDRFPGDFMFRLTPEEARRSRSQTVILNAQDVVNAAETSSDGGSERGQNIKYLPYAFTEQGVAMLSSVLRSPRAIRVNVEIAHAFVRLRQLLQSNAGLAQKLAALEKKYDAQFKVVFDAIRQLMEPPPHPTKQIGFRGP
jgi:hypothetical protein